CPLVKCRVFVTLQQRGHARPAHSPLRYRRGREQRLALKKPRLIFQSRGYKVAAPFKKRTSGLPTGSILRREAKNLVQVARKPLARYGAVEGALARDLLLPGQNWTPIDRRRSPMTADQPPDAPQSGGVLGAVKDKPYRARKCASLT